ncbi:MAG: oxidoreductase [Oscillospiraceae bacterium]|nr:oxidoreductase [Oscillospiraceae bacterium]
MRPGMLVDAGRCMACYACFMACKDEHCGWGSALTKPQPEMGQYWMNIVEWERGDSERRIKTASVPTLCEHCENPWCMAAAKDGAVYKRPDGIVIIDPEKAVGQCQIVDACPIHAIYWNEALQLPQKCTLCAELLDDPEYPGKEPRCSEACPNQALIFGDLDDPDNLLHQRMAIRHYTPLTGFPTDPHGNVIHVDVPTAFLFGTVYYPEEEEEVCIGAHVKMVCEDGTVYEQDTNWAGDYEFEWLPEGKKFHITITKDGYKPIEIDTETGTGTHADHVVGMHYLEEV